MLAYDEAGMRLDRTKKVRKDNRHPLLPDWGLSSNIFVIWTLGELI